MRTCVKLLLQSFPRQRLVKQKTGQSNCKNQHSPQGICLHRSLRAGTMPPIVIWILVLSCQEKMTLFPLLIFLLLFPLLYLSSSSTSFLRILLPLLLNSVWYRGTFPVCLQTLSFSLVPIPFCLVKVKPVS